MERTPGVGELSVQVIDAVPVQQCRGEVVGTVVRGESPCRPCGRSANLGSTDRLTGLLDRWSWDDAAAAVLGSGRRAVLLLADLDSFKKINDEVGHPSGDLVLRAVADVLRNRTRGQDVLGRYGGHGGDEFLVLLPGTTESQAERLARDIQSGIEAITLTTASTADAEVTITGLSASVGLAAVAGGETPALESLILRADVALRAAKRHRHAPAEKAPRIVEHDLFARRLLDLRQLIDSQPVRDVLHAMSVRPLRRSDIVADVLALLEREGLVRRVASKSTYELTSVGRALLDIAAAMHRTS